VYTEKELIEECLKGKKDAQKALYDKYAGKMFALCMRYARHKLEAEDIMQEGFIKVFENLETFRAEGSLEGWIRTIMVHTAIKNYNRSSFQKESIGLENYPEESMIPKAYADLNKEELMKLIKDLPEGYRMVFNMYAIEGFKHKEIAKMLNIGESTSRSQLVKARKLLQSMIEKLYTVIL
jgi:RNA polymerase sigma-70 factor (ECF subfamily)